MKILKRKIKNIHTISITLILILAFSCKKDIDPPLVIPPNFSKMPELDKEISDNDKEDQSKDLKPLRDILLK